MTTAYWCLGSNLEAQKHIAFAVEQFQQKFPKLSVSKVYRSAAIGFTGGDFLNVVVATDTSLPLQRLLDYAAQLEDAAGRVRIKRGRFDSRTLDVDLLMLGQLQGFHFGRHWPNDDIIKYAHVLRPLLDVAADEAHPILAKPFSQLWDEFEHSKDQLMVVDNLI